MRRKILIPIDEANRLTAEAQKRAEAGIEELRKLGITIDEVRTLLSEWIGRNLGLYDRKKILDSALRMGVSSNETKGFKDPDRIILAIFRKEVKMANAMPEDVL